MNCDILINRLQNVRRTSRNSWVAACPSHSDRSPSLSIRELEDGRILLHCFAGCGTDSVLSAIGLAMSDLFPARIGDREPRALRISPVDLLIILDHELLVAAIILREIVRDRVARESQVTRLSQSAARVGKARDMVAALKVNCHA